MSTILNDTAIIGCSKRWLLWWSMVRWWIIWIRSWSKIVTRMRTWFTCWEIIRYWFRIIGAIRWCRWIWSTLSRESDCSGSNLMLLLLMMVRWWDSMMRSGDHPFFFFLLSVLSFTPYFEEAKEEGESILGLASLVVLRRKLFAERKEEET